MDSYVSQMVQTRENNTGALLTVLERGQYLEMTRVIANRENNLQVRVA
jgi:hypothetical protein